MENFGAGFKGKSEKTTIYVLEGENNNGLYKEIHGTLWPKTNKNPDTSWGRGGDQDGALNFYLRLRLGGKSSIPTL